MNNKGFAVTTSLYAVLMLALLVIATLMSTMSQNRKNTHELTDVIDKELNTISSKDALFDKPSEQSIMYYVKDGEEGFYKVDLFGRDEYTSALLSIAGNTRIYVYVSPNTSKPHSMISMMNGSYVGADSNYVLSSKISTPKNIPTSIKVFNNYHLDKASEYTSNSPRVRIQKVDKDSNANVSVGSTATSLPNGSYYIFATKKASENEISARVLTSSPNKTIIPETFTGEDNQSWSLISVGNNRYTLTKSDGTMLALSSSIPTDGQQLIASSPDFYGVDHNSEKVWQLNKLAWNGAFNVWQISPLAQSNLTYFTPVLTFGEAKRTIEIRNKNGKSFETFQGGVPKELYTKTYYNRIILVPSNY